MKFLTIPMEAVRWSQEPDGSGFKKSGRGDAEECSCNGRGMSRRVLLSEGELNADSWSQQREIMKM